MRRTNQLLARFADPTYSIDDGHGNLITTGLASQTARSTAQRIADERGESVYLYADPDGDTVEIRSQP